MKILELIKEIWKQNKRGYFVSGIITTFGCLFLYAIKGFPLQYTIPFSWLGLFVFMFCFGFFFGGND